MKYAFSVPTTTGEERESLFAKYTDSGYDGLQLKRGQFRDYIGTPERFVDLWGYLTGVASALIVGGELDPDGLDELRNAIRFASKVDGERVLFCHTVARAEVSDGDIRNFAKILSDVGAEAREMGIALSLHHHYNQPVMHRSDFDLFFGSVQDGTVGLTIDTAHLVKSGIDDIAELIRAFDKVTDNFHLKDFADGEFRVLGQGNIDFGPVFQAIRETGFDGWLCADEESGGDINKTLGECYAFLRKGTADS